MYFCGWDGGGTKTGVCIQDETGTLTEAAFGPLNLNGAAEDRVAATVRNGVAFMAAQPGGLAACAGLVIGMAGASNADASARVERMVREAGYEGPFKLLGDQEIALAGAIDGPGAVLIAGTGAICFGRDGRGERFRVGGYGYLIDDGGSGYAIGRDILTAVVRAEDGRGPKTALTGLVFEALHVDQVGGLVTWLYGPGTGKKEIAALAPLLLRALEAGDAAAQAIAERAADDLSELVITAWRKRDIVGGELALTGSVPAYYPTIRARLEAALRKALPGIAIVEPRRSPALGASALAREIFG